MFSYLVYYINIGELSNALCIFQYPLRPNERPYGDQGKLSSVQMNNNLNEFSLKFNFNIDNKSKNYDNNQESKVSINN